MNDDLLHRIALTLVPNIGAVQARILVDQFRDAAAIFRASAQSLAKLDGIGDMRAGYIKKFAQFKKAEEEILFLEKYGIRALFLTDDDYPKRLLNCYDPPTVLYYRGKANLNAHKIIAVVGTRGKTEYGRQLTEKLLADLHDQQVVVVSGLALGIDATAHKNCLQQRIPTVAVVGHGLDKIYPMEHAGLARDIIEADGGLLTEFRSKTKPDRHHFPSRNRIVAGMSDATVVIETNVKGGSMITADLANGYNRDVFAFPGRVSDPKSAGCNQLIKNNKAVLLSSAAELLETMGWQEKNKPAAPKQRQLFVQLTADEETIVKIMGEKDGMAIDELNMKSKLSMGTVAAVILSLELKNVVLSLPGKMYRLA